MSKAIENLDGGPETAALQADATAVHDTMQMGMKVEGLSPGMQDAEKADLRSQVLRIGGHRLQGIGGRSKQQIVHQAFVLESEGGQFCRQSKNTTWKYSQSNSSACLFSSHLALAKDFVHLAASPYLAHELYALRSWPH